jgi:hypothetical protein
MCAGNPLTKGRKRLDINRTTVLCITVSLSYCCPGKKIYDMQVAEYDSTATAVW